MLLALSQIRLRLSRGVWRARLETGVLYLCRKGMEEVPQWYWQLI